LGFQIGSKPLARKSIRRATDMEKVEKAAISSFHRNLSYRVALCMVIRAPIGWF
jgi:hypothetical protein